MIAGGIVLLVVIVIAIAGVLVWHVKRKNRSPNQSGNDRIYHNKFNEDERNTGNSRQKPNINHTPVWKKHKNLDKTSEIHINLLNKKTDGQRFDGANRNADEKEKHVTAPSLSSDTKRGAEENDDDDGSGTCGPDKPVQCTDDIGSKGT